MRVYLAGPMRKIAQFNFPAFDAGAATLRALGHKVFNPADRDRDLAGFDPTKLTGHEDLAAMGFSLRDALAADTEYIAKHADAVALLPGWEKSSGVAAEVALAHALGLPVGELVDFTKAGPIRILDAPNGSSGTIHANVKLTGVTEVPVDDLRRAAAALGNLGRNTASLKPADDTRVSFSKGGEVRTTSATGGEKGTKPERYDLIPVGALAQVAALYGRGAAKYAAHNWRRGYEWSKSYAALQRHATQFWNGEDNDAEMDLPHMASVAFHALALLTFMEEQPGFDDRYKPEATEPDCICDGIFSACSACHTKTTNTKP